jgi:hypothetical protein
LKARRYGVGQALRQFVQGGRIKHGLSIAERAARCPVNESPTSVAGLTRNGA